MTKPNILLTPGPTPVPQAVLDVLAEPIFHHRTPQFQKIYRSVSDRVRNVFMTKNPVYILAGSGTAAMEASMVNFHSAGDEVLVLETGKFGERFVKMAKAFGLKVAIVKTKDGETVELQAVRDALKNNPKIKTIFTQSCETSTAVLNDIKGIASITRNTDVLLVIDAISGLAADRLETDNWGVDIVVSGSQKALMMPPGLAFISVSEKARKRIDSSTLPRFYFNLKAYEKSLADNTSPFTPAIGLILGLQKSLDLIEAEGLENVFKRCNELGEFTRKGLKNLGLELFSKAPSATVSAAVVPEGVDGKKLIKIMRDEKGVTLAGGQGDLTGKIIRISHMGYITRENIVTGLKILGETLQELKVNA